MRDSECFRACLKTTRGAVFGEKAGWRGATKENIPGGSSTEEQRSQTAFSAKTLRAAGLLSVAGVGSVVTARCGDAAPSPPWPQTKSLAAAPLVVFKQALREASGARLRLFAFAPGENASISVKPLIGWVNYFRRNCLVWRVLLGYVGQSIIGMFVQALLFLAKTFAVKSSRASHSFIF
jgi:hypothetical protein